VREAAADGYYFRADKLVRQMPRNRIFKTRDKI
jgi:hypothetical protein